MTESLGLFAKYWQPGEVKTRLGAAIGDRQAAAIYRQFVVALVGRLSDCRTEKWLAYTPYEHQREFQQIVSNDWILELQAEGDLGDRMRAFFANRLASGSERTVLLGSDSPQMPLESIEQAFEQLRRHQLVLGPSEDGGYWLIGVSGTLPSVFNDIPWGTPAVWEATVDRLRATNTSYGMLPVCYDVDEQSDLERLIRDLHDQAGCDRHLDRLRESLITTD